MMLQRRRPDDTSGLLRLRYTDEWVGLLVLIAAALFFGAIFEAGVVRRWLKPDSELRILLPQGGVGGLAPGADIQVLGTQMGSVNQIVLNPDGTLYATASIRQQADPYIRRDSKATIRLRYAVAGAAYIDISRGTGKPLDWNFAVLKATVAPNPADAITRTISEIRAQILPLLQHANQSVSTLGDLVAGLKAGHGSVGKLLTDDTLINQATATMATLRADIARLEPILAKVPPLLDQSHAVLGNVRKVTGNAAQATPALPAIASNLKTTSANLPALTIQTQATLEQLDKLLAQLRGSWLLGGGGSNKPESLRLPPQKVRP